MNTQIMTGHDLPDYVIETMNSQRVHEYGTNTKNFRQNEQDSTFFLLREDDRMKAFGMLKPVTVIHRKQMTSILGIGNIIAVDKGEGNGRQIMLAIKDFLTDKRRIGLGFCDSSVSGFYQTCGYRIVSDLDNRFRYSLAHQSDEREKLNRTLDMLCYDPIGGFIETLLASEDLIYINQPFW